MTFLHFIYILGLVVWIGGIIFFSFFTAPAIFKTLEREQAGEVVGVIFPSFYKIGYACSLLTLTTLIASTGSVQDLRAVFLLVMAVCTIYAGQVVGPKARELKGQMKTEDDEVSVESMKVQFDKLHTLSVRLNGTVLILGIGVLWITAMNMS